MKAITGLMTLFVCVLLSAFAAQAGGDSRGACGSYRPGDGRFKHITPEYLAQAEGKFLGSLNAYRLSRGLKPLRAHPLIKTAAIKHANDMASGDFMSHQGSDGSNSFERIKSTGYRARYAAENIGVGQKSVEDIFQAWQKSPGHDRNLLSPNAQEMSLVLAYRENTSCRTYWVLDLGTSFSY